MADEIISSSTGEAIKIEEEKEEITGVEVDLPPIAVKLPKEKILMSIPTKDLVEELKKREGVESATVEPHNKLQPEIKGPAIVLKIID
ncbi:BC1881 family protein [Halanaerocella petrolearia]